MPHHPEQAYLDGEEAYIEGIEDLGFSFGIDRKFDGSSPLAKTTGIKGRRGNPTHEQIGLAAALGTSVQVTDQIWTIWEGTFHGNAVKVMPAPADIILVNATNTDGSLITPVSVAERWVLKWSKLVMYGAQYLCYCQISNAQADPLY